MPLDKRETEREPGYAKVWVKELKSPAYLRDMNIGGIKLAIPDNIRVGKDDKLSLVIIPEETIGIPSFELEVEIRWTRNEEIYTTIGTSITSFPKPLYRTSYEHLLEYYLSQG